MRSLIRFVDCEKLFKIVSRVTCILKLTKMHSDILDIRREREKERKRRYIIYRMLSNVNEGGKDEKKKEDKERS